MPKPRQRAKKKLRRNTKGQFLILSAVIIIIVMISFASLLAQASVQRVSLTKTDFREVTIEVTMNYRGALGVAIAEVSKSLDFMASTSRYVNYTNLDEYPNATSGGYEFMSEWHKTLLRRYPGLGLNLSVSQPLFQCNWSGNPGYSVASSNASLDILAYDFYGWKNEVEANLNVTIMDLYPNGTDGKTIAFYFKMIKENGVPVTVFSEDMASILFRHVESDEFTLSKYVSLTYLGGGYYLAEFSMYSTTILEGLNMTKDLINELDPANFTWEHRTTGQWELCNWIDDVAEYYNDTLLEPAYINLTDFIRPKLVPRGTGTWVVDDASTTQILAWIDIVRSQLLPTVRVAFQDPRGIVVGAVRIYSDVESEDPFYEDNIGPITRDLSVSPNPTQNASSVTLSAWIDDTATGLSNINASEYFINATGQNGTGIPIPASDGSFNSPVERAEILIDISSWAEGSHIIYVHGNDSAGNWGGFSSIIVTVTSLTQMDVSSTIEMRLYQFRFFAWRLYQAEAVVKIVNASGYPVSGATVYGHWDGPPGYVQGTTDARGEVSFLSERGWGRRWFVFTVDDVEKAGYVYNPALYPPIPPDKPNGRIRP